MDITTSLYTCKLVRLTRTEMDKEPETLDALFMGVLREDRMKQFSAGYHQ